MKFTKNDVKKSFTECNRSKDDNRCMVRSLFGVVPEFEAMGGEKVSGILSFANERLVIDFVKSRYERTGITYLSDIAKNLKSHFEKITKEECDEHCVVLVASENGTQSVVFHDPDDVKAFIESQSNKLIVIVHFLPSVARDMYYVVSNNSYHISYSNRFSFNGQNFLAKVAFERGSVFGSRSMEQREEKIISFRDQLSKKFGQSNVKAKTKQHPFEGTQIVGFEICFDKLSHINILKLVKFDLEYNVEIKASLKSMGMTKEELDE